MIAPLAKFIDWSVLQMAYVVAPLRHAPKPKWKLEEALEFLNVPDFIPAASDPARMEFDGPRHFKFPTPRPGEVAENNIVYGRLYRCAERWQERPVILLIEGIHDLFAARQPIEDLWQKWEQPEIWRLPHGHISAQLVLGLMGHVLRWLAPRLEAGGKNNA